MERDETYSLKLSSSQRLADALRVLRTRAGLTQAEVAKRAGISTYTYQKFESNFSKPGRPMNPRFHTLVALARVFGVPVSTLLDFDLVEHTMFEGFDTSDAENHGHPSEPEDSQKPKGTKLPELRSKTLEDAWLTAADQQDYAREHHEA